MEDDSDMLMEPNQYSPITILRSQERQFHEPMTTQFHPIADGSRLSSRADVRATAIHHDSHSQAAQNYYPPFFREAPPLGHSRPYFPLHESGVLSKYSESRPLSNLGPGGLSVHQRAAGFDHSILGSGDFGVIRGGTFYPDEDTPYHTEDGIDFVQKYTYPEEQFAHFRDFADISTPVDAAFSKFVVVYENRNSSVPNSKTADIASSIQRPKNIFEQLQLLDEEKAQEQQQHQQQLKKSSLPSKSKLKLAKTKLEQKKYKKKMSSQIITKVSPPYSSFEDEPLLALS